MVQDPFLVFDYRVQNDDHGALQVAQVGGHFHELLSVNVAVHEPELGWTAGISGVYP